VLSQYFSVEDDYGNRIVPHEFRNPIPELPEGIDDHHYMRNYESDKNVLPYHYMEELRCMLCPKDARNFSDWTWAQAIVKSEGIRNDYGDWFMVSFEMIDESDPDCIWRTREPSEKERTKYGHGEIVHELWSPARAVALYVKLHLPLRTYQVRMLDSGEADTLRYQHGEWERNAGPLAKGSEKNSYRHGVFRRMKDNFTHVEMTGLFINTNKTADRSKDEWTKGYEIPWQHAEVLRWLEKLRDWQEKYNPIPSPTPWTSLNSNHIGAVKSPAILKEMGTSCFLFRRASAKGEDRFKPIAADQVRFIWYKLLLELETLCDARRECLPSGNKLHFVNHAADGRFTTFYPLHALRVSLITAYALEGGVPMPILSKCIAGHARLIMTLYYTKAGITYITEKMEEAEKRLMETEQTNFLRWAKDAKYKELQANGAYCDPASIQAVIHAQASGTSLVKNSKGICPKGGWGCDSGGIYVNDNTGQITYGTVPGYPEKNCPRCRWFITGPAFLPGLQSHWNFIHLQMGDLGDRIVTMEGQITALEDEKYECQANDRPFLKHDQLNKLRNNYQVEIQKNDKLATDSTATLRLIARCEALVKKTQANDGMQLVAAGGLSDVRIAITECDKLQQILTAVAGSTIFPEHDTSKATLQAGRAYDMMLAINGKTPVLFGLTEDEQLLVVQHITKLLQAEVGSIKDALPFVDGVRKLAELGLDQDIERIVLEVTNGNYAQFDCAKLTDASSIMIHSLPSDTRLSDQKVSIAG